MPKWSIAVILVVICILIAVIPLVIIRNSEFGGADGQAEEIISEIDPEYEAWADNLIELPGGETESLLFCVQAAVGSGILFFCFGYLAARKKYTKKTDNT